jgi:hypothetical protein
MLSEGQRIENRLTIDIEKGCVMGSRTVGVWLLAAIVIAPAGILLGTHSPKVPTNVADVSEEEHGISLIGLAVTFDGKYVITSNKNTSDGAVFSTPSLRLLRRVHISESLEFIKINLAGDRLFATFEPSSGGGPSGAAKAGASGDHENGLPAQIATFHAKNWTPGAVSTAGQETEGMHLDPAPAQ